MMFKFMRSSEINLFFKQVRLKHVSSSKRFILINNRSIINWHIGFNDHTLLQFVNMIALYDIFVVIYFVRCSKSICYHRWQITVVTVFDTCYRCTMLTFFYQSGGIDTSTLVQELYLDCRYHFPEVLQHRLFNKCSLVVIHVSKWHFVTSWLFLFFSVFLHIFNGMWSIVLLPGHIVDTWYNCRYFN